MVVPVQHMDYVAMVCRNIDFLCRAVGFVKWSSHLTGISPWPRGRCFWPLPPWLPADRFEKGHANGILSVAVRFVDSPDWQIRRGGGKSQTNYNPLHVY